ncbi:MAG: hypothetical protein HDQ89_10445 [Desulfovibrio sp.]|nr:hypothetical protein [Desulfovibrio sp.]
MINKVGKRHRYRSKFFMKRYHKYQNFMGHRNKWNIISLPKEISIEGKYRKELLSCISRILELVSDDKKNIILDFKKTKLIIATGMIIFYAEISNLINQDNNIHFKCININSNRVEQVLKQVRFLSKCRYKSKARITRSDVINWRVCSGKSLIYSKFDEVVLQENIFKQLPPESDLYAGCVEATKNVMRHAYIEELRRIPICRDKEAWWCFTQIKDQKLTMVVCDLGVSIPYTLPKTKKKLVRWMALFPFFGKQIEDADLIDGAIRMPSSRSGESFRGNGLPKIAEIARVCGGALTIHSRSGYIHYENSDAPIKHNYIAPVHGTVIAWTLPLGGKICRD